MIPWQDLQSGNHRMSCPCCGRSERDKTLGVTIEDGAGVAHCFRCSYVETWRDDRRTRLRPSVQPQRTPQASRKYERLSEYGHAVWNATKGLPGTLAADYLLARACTLPPADGDLRFHPALKHPSGYVGPALVGLVTDVRTREPISLHRTWIRADGTKADVDPPRLMLGGHRKQGGAIRLWPDEAVICGIGIGEGVETTLTLATAVKPVWSLIDAGNMAAFPHMAGMLSLTIATDNDPAGLKAARECATRWTEAGCDVRLVVPPREGSDLNDLAREGA